MSIPGYCILCDRQYVTGYPHPGHGGRRERSPRLPIPVVLGFLWVLVALAGAVMVVVEVFQ